MLAQLQGALAGENSPNREHAVSVEMIVGNQLNAARQFVPVRRGDEIQGDLCGRVSFKLRRCFVSLPVRKVNSIVDCAVDRQFVNVFKTGMIVLKTHRELLVVKGTFKRYAQSSRYSY